MARTIKETLYVVNHLRNLILNNTYSKGEKMPSETKLATQLNVSRNTLRKALSILEKENMITIRKNFGAFVSYDTTSTPPTFIPLISSTPKESPLFLYIYHGVQEYFSQYNYNILLSMANFSPVSEKTIVLDYIEKGFKNLIIIPTASNEHEDFYNELIQDSYNIVFIDRSSPNIFCNCISSNNYRGGYLAAKELLQLNLKKVYFCTDSSLESMNTCLERYNGFCFYSKIKKINIEIESVLVNNNTISDFLYTLRNQQDEAIGLFCTNDTLATQISNLMLNSNFYLPIIGFDNTPSNMSLVGITTVAQPLRELGYQGALTLHEHMQDPEKPLCHKKLPVKLISRQSTDKEFLKAHLSPNSKITL